MFASQKFMKILLINAPREGEVAEFASPNFLSNDFFHMPPLGLLAIAAEVNPLHDLKVFDPVTKNMSIPTAFATGRIKKHRSHVI